MRSKKEKKLIEGINDILEGVFKQNTSEETDVDMLIAALSFHVRENEIAKRQCEEAVRNMEDCIVHLDIHGNCLFLSQSWSTLTGSPYEGSVGAPFIEYFSEEYRGKILDAIKTTIDWNISTRCEMKPINKSHPIQWLTVRLQPMLNEANLLVGIRGILSDDTERRIAEENIRLSMMAFDTTSEGILITDSNHKILKVNNAFENITGYSKSEIIGKTPKIMNSGIHDSSFFANMWKSIHETGGWRGEIWNRRKNGSIYPEILSINSLRGQDGDLTHYVAMFTDISSLKNAEKNANIDPITKLANRFVFSDRLHHAIAQSHENGSRVAVLCVDLDNFKDINDSLGHTNGDMILKETGVRLTKLLSGKDTIARLGGDEFAVIIESFDALGDVAKTADTLLEAFRIPHTIQDHDFFVSASIGIAIYPDDGKTPDQLSSASEVAMYKAKEQGRNRYQFYKESNTEEADHRLKIESGLHRALAGNEFKMVYQPQINLATGELTGTEALIRWNSPKIGSVPPDQFIRVAERTGLIESIGHWAFMESCQKIVDAKNLPDGFCISVNLSTIQLRNPMLIEQIRGIIEKTGIDPYTVEIELTESCLAHNPDDVQKILRNIRDLGISIAIDDFGTGYSSLAYLKKFPISKLKIDRSFIKDLPSSTEDAAITKAIIALAHSLGMKVVAEGVETIEQVEFLILAQCDMAQGYFISRPTELDNVKHSYDMGIFT